MNQGSARSGWSFGIRGHGVDSALRNSNNRIIVETPQVVRDFARENNGSSGDEDPTKCFHSPDAHNASPARDVPTPEEDPTQFARNIDTPKDAHFDDPEELAAVRDHLQGQETPKEDVTQFARNINTPKDAHFDDPEELAAIRGHLQGQGNWNPDMADAQVPPVPSQKDAALIAARNAAQAVLGNDSDDEDDSSEGEYESDDCESATMKRPFPAEPNQETPDMQLHQILNDFDLNSNRVHSVGGTGITLNINMTPDCGMGDCGSPERLSPLLETNLQQSFQSPPVLDTNHASVQQQFGHDTSANLAPNFEAMSEYKRNENPDAGRDGMASEGQENKMHVEDSNFAAVPYDHQVNENPAVIPEDHDDEKPSKERASKSNESRKPPAKKKSAKVQIPHRVGGKQMRTSKKKSNRSCSKGAASNKENSSLPKGSKNGLKMRPKLPTQRNKSLTKRPLQKVPNNTEAAAEATKAKARKSQPPLAAKTTLIDNTLENESNSKPEVAKLKSKVPVRASDEQATAERKGHERFGTKKLKRTKKDAKNAADREASNIIINKNVISETEGAPKPAVGPVYIAEEENEIADIRADALKLLETTETATASRSHSVFRDETKPQEAYPYSSFLSPTICRFTSPKENQVTEIASKLLDGSECAAGDITNAYNPEGPAPVAVLHTPIDQAGNEDDTSEVEEVDVSDKYGNVNPLVGYPMTGIDPWLLDSMDTSEPPHSSEILQWLSHPIPDTFPLSYYFRLLGLEVEESKSIGANENKFKVSIPRDETSHFIPRRGRAFDVWKQQQKQAGKIHDDYKGTLYESFVNEGWNEKFLVSFNPGDVPFAMEEKIQDVRNSELVDMSAWLVEPTSEIVEEGRIWSFEAQNTLTRFPSTFKLSFRLHHYCELAQEGEDPDPLELANSPVVVTIRNLKSFENDVLLSEDGDDSPILLVLFGLVIETAFKCGATYCLLDVSNLKEPFIEVLRVHFRMDWVQSSGSDTKEKLVCDLVSCNLAYALLYRSSFCQGERNIQPTVKERLLVGFQQPVATSSKKKARRPQDKPQDRPKCVGIRVKKACIPDGESRASGIEMVYIDNKGQEGGRVWDVKGDSSTDFGWQVFKSFHLPSPSANVDEIVNRLTKKQQELEKLESKLMGSKILELVKKVVEERRDYERAENVNHRSNTIETLERYYKKYPPQKYSRSYQQREDDMEAQCCICMIDKVTPHNAIVICDGCEMAAHQDCYGIDVIPNGKYFCRRCAANEDAVCVLCPDPDGAFQKLAYPGRWVHEVCARMQGLRKLDYETYEDPTERLEAFPADGKKCYFCRSEYGGLFGCNDTRCNRFMHVTCAKASSTCCVSLTERTISCPEHYLKATPVEECSDEELVERPRENEISFQTRDQQREALKDPDYECSFLTKLSDFFKGARCDVCSSDWAGQNAKKDRWCPCQRCGARVCVACIDPSEGEQKSKDGIMLCGGCQHATASGSSPTCVLCSQKSGWLRKARAIHKQSVAKQGAKMPATFYTKDIWCHKICARVHVDVANQDKRSDDDDEHYVDISAVVMKNGKSFKKANVFCSLCGNNNGLKKACRKKGCKSGIKGRSPHSFHATCAWQAGFSVNAPNLGEKEFGVACMTHSETGNNLRAKIEDLLDIEETRTKEQGANASLRDDEAAQVLNAAIDIMRILGWAWRWEEWWVKKNFNWEPYIPVLKEGQTEADFTDEEKRIVRSAPADRQRDALQCNLTAFSAALRNRNYDTAGGFDNQSLHRALRAILKTKTLVGPLKDSEIDFLEEWLGRAYRSKSRYLCFGPDKIEIGPARFCREKGKPKFELGDRLLPGKEISDCSGLAQDGDDGDDDDDGILKPRKRGRPRRKGQIKKRNRTVAVEQNTSDACAHNEPSKANCATFITKDAAPASEKASASGESSSDERAKGKMENKQPEEELPTPSVTAENDPSRARKKARLDFSMEREEAPHQAVEETHYAAQEADLKVPANRKREREDSNLDASRPSKEIAIAVAESGGSEGCASAIVVASPIVDSSCLAVDTNGHEAADENYQSPTKRLFADESLPKDNKKRLTPAKDFNHTLQSDGRIGDSEDDEENEDDTETESEDESVKSVHTVRTRRSDGQNPKFQAAVKKAKAKLRATRQPPKSKSRVANRLSGVTAETAKLTASPGCKSMNSDAGKSYTSRRPKPSGPSRGVVNFEEKPTVFRPAKVVEEKPTVFRPAKVGIKGSSVNEDDLVEDEPDDNESRFVDDATFSGRSLHVKQDEVSVLTEYTYFPKSHLDDDAKSNTSDPMTIDAAVKQAEIDHFSVSRAEFPIAKIKEFRCRHQPANYKNQLRSCCVLCSTAEKPVKTKNGCRECFMLAFEHKYEVLIDRNNFPLYFASRAVFLCDDESKGYSCYERWHNQD